jgi:hypothetical protein
MSNTKYVVTYPNKTDPKVDVNFSVHETHDV